MSVTDTMRGYGRSAKDRAGAMGHSMRDRSVEKRLERATEQAERLRFENDLLRDEVEETRQEHRKILDMVEERLPVPGRRHPGRWLVFLALVGGAAYAVVRRLTVDEDWVSKLRAAPDLPSRDASAA
ncbi:MAG TPA: hypothetical protein VIC58_03230 [Actinomycetota bacterium]|jgi:hypothetical protein